MKIWRIDVFEDLKFFFEFLFLITECWNNVHFLFMVLLILISLSAYQLEYSFDISFSKQKFFQTDMQL